MTLVNNSPNTYRFRLSSSIIKIAPGQSVDITPEQALELKDSFGLMELTGMEIIDDSVPTPSRKTFSADKATATD